jgi:methyl-accepting chemotaxis protein
MRNASIARKMALVMVASVAITIGAILGLSYLLRVSSAAARGVATTARVQSQASFELLDLVVKVQGGTQKMVQADDPDVIESIMHQNDELVKQAKGKIQQIAQGDTGVSAAFDKLIQADDQVKDLVMHAHNAESHQAIIEKCNPAFEVLLATISKHQDKVAQALDSQATIVSNHTAHLEVIVYFLVCVSVVVLCLYSLALIRTVSQSLRRVINMIQDIAERDGDLTKRLQVESHDELGELAKWFNSFMEKLHKVVLKVAQSAEQVASASEEISATANQSAEGARLQSDQTHQVATAMQEMSATVQQVSENSHRAAESADKAAQAARQGGQVVEETLSTMHSIADSTSKVAVRIVELGRGSERIGKIIAVIDDIADQTNLLALNAAIEAARAGEQGRGFAVVADEVRKLAERTTKATKEIAAMIEAIQGETKNAVQAMEQGNRNVKIGVDKTSASGTALKEIIRMAEEVGQMISQIATAAGQQSSATVEINANLSQISSSVQASASAATQTARACTGLSSLALDLHNLVGQFKLQAESGITGKPPSVADDLESHALAASEPARYKAAAAGTAD